MRALRLLGLDFGVEISTQLLARMGDAAYFLGHDLAIVECLGPLSAEELAEPELASVAVTVPSSVRSQDSNPESLVQDVSPIGDAGNDAGNAGDTSKMRRVSRPERSS